MASDQDNTAILKLLSDVVTNTNNISRTLSETLDSGDSERERKANDKRQDQSFKTFKRATQDFQKAVNADNKSSNDVLKQINMNSRFLQDAMSEVAASDIKPDKIFAELEKTLKMQDQLDAMHELRESFETGAATDPATIKEFEDKLAKAGLTLTDVGADIAYEWDETGDSLSGLGYKIKSVTIPSLDALDEKTNELSESAKKASDSMRKMARDTERNKKIINGAFGALAASAGIYITESRKVLGKGLGDARDGILDTGKTIAQLGISTSSYMDILADNRRVQLAMSAAGKNWKDEIIKTSIELRKSGFVESNQEAALAAAAFAKNTSMMGVSQSSLGDAMQDQQKIYASHFRALGMSTSQFNALTEDMLADTDIRADLAKLDEKERRGYVESLQKRTAENAMMGISIERSRELNKHFARMSSEDPLKRISEGANMRAFMGSLGLGDLGARYQEIVAKLPTLEGKEKVEAQAEMTKMLAETQKVLKERRGSSQGADIAFGSLAQQLNVMEKLTLAQTEVQKGLDLRKGNETVEQANKRLAKEQKAKEGNIASMVAVYGKDTVEALATSSTTAALTSAAVIGIAQTMPTITKLLTAQLGMSKGLIGKAGAAAIIGTAIYSGYELVVSGGKHSSVNDLVKEIAPEFEKNLGGWLSNIFNSDQAKEQKELRDRRNTESDDRNAEMAMYTKQLIELQKENNKSTRDGTSATLSQTEVQKLQEESKTRDRKITIVRERLTQLMDATPSAPGSS